MALITETALRAMLKKGIPNPYPLYEGDKITPAALDFLKGRGIQFNPYNSAEVVPQTEHLASQLTIPVGVSNRHLHLSSMHVEQLFGSNYRLTPLRNLSQPGQFAAQEQVTLLGPKGFLKDVRVLGPPREVTQVEISKADGFQLGVHPPVRLSGLIEETPSLTLIGPQGCVTLEKGVIIAKCHVHMSTNDAQEFGVKTGDQLMLQALGGNRSLIFTDVAVRISPNYVLDFHIDVDEANAASLKTGDRVTVVGKNGQFFLRNGRGRSGG